MVSDHGSGPVARPGPRWQSQVPFWGLVHGAVSAAAGPFTIGENFCLAASYHAIQLIFANPGPAQCLGAVIAAPSASRVSPTVPSDASGAPVAWTAVTMGGATPVLQAGLSADRPWVGLSDVIPLRSLPRTDGGQFPLLFTRVLSPAGTLFHPTVLATHRSVLDRYDRESGGRGVDCYVAGGDFVSNALLQASLTDSVAAADSLFSYVAGVRFLSEAPAMTIMGSGDSLTSGYVNGSGFNGFGLRASIELTPRHGIAVSHVANAYPGQCSFDFVANAMVAIDLLQPDIVTIPIDSPNDYMLVPPRDAAPVCLGMLQRALELVAYAVENQAVPVLVTPIPFGHYDDPERYGPLRTQSGAVVRALCSSPAMVLDAQAAISGFIPAAGRSPALPSHYRAWDDAHLNDEGQRVIGAELARLLDPICAGMVNDRAFPVTAHPAARG